MKIFGLRWPLTVAAALAVAIVGVLVLLVDVIPPRSMTVNRIRFTAGRILEFAKVHNRLPASLLELPARKGYDNETTDGWGCDILYEVKPDGMVSLTSYGRDRRPGGGGEDADCVGTFNPRGQDGTWRDQLEWAHESWEKANMTTTEP